MITDWRIRGDWVGGLDTLFRRAVAASKDPEPTAKTTHCKIHTLSQGFSPCFLRLISLFSSSGPVPWDPQSWVLRSSPKQNLALLPYSSA